MDSEVNGTGLCRVLPSSLGRGALVAGPSEQDTTSVRQQVAKRENLQKQERCLIARGILT